MVKKYLLLCIGILFACLHPLEVPADAMPDVIRYEELETLVLTQTTTIGIRRYPTERTVLERSEIQVETSYGPADVKVCAYKGRKFFYPEYESIRRICMEQGADFQTAYHQVRRKAEESRQD